MTAVLADAPAALPDTGFLPRGRVVAGKHPFSREHAGEVTECIRNRGVGHHDRPAADPLPASAVVAFAASALSAARPDGLATAQVLAEVFWVVVGSPLLGNVATLHGRRSPQDSWSCKASSRWADHRADHHADDLPVLGVFIDHDWSVFGVRAARLQFDAILGRSVKALQRDVGADSGYHDVAVCGVPGCASQRRCPRIGSRLTTCCRPRTTM